MDTLILPCTFLRRGRSSSIGQRPVRAQVFLNFRGFHDKTGKVSSHFAALPPHSPLDQATLLLYAADGCFTMGIVAMGNL